MTKLSELNPQKLATGTFMTTILLVTVMFFAVVGTFVSGFERVNPSYNNTHLEYPISDEAVSLVKNATIFIFGPLSVVLLILSSINLKRKSTKLSWGILSVVGVTIAWLVFMDYALTMHRVQNTSDSPPSDGTLQIRRLNLN